MWSQHAAFGIVNDELEIVRRTDSDLLDRLRERSRPLVVLPDRLLQK